MSEILPTPETNLYGESPNAPAPLPAPPQGLGEQLVGVFTEPAMVFQRLRQAPAWVGAFVAVMATGLFASLAWAAKVDMEAATRRRMEVMEQLLNKPMPTEAVDQALEKAVAGGQPWISSSLGVVLGMTVGFLILAGVMFAFNRLGSDDDEVTFTHAWAAAIVHTLSVLPMMLMAGILCLLRPVGGAASYASLAPTTLGYWIHPESPWLRGLLGLTDVFYLFSFVVFYFAAKHTLRLKTWAIVVLMGLCAFFGFLFHFLGGVFA